MMSQRSQLNVEIERTHRNVQQPIANNNLRYRSTDYKLEPSAYWPQSTQCEHM